MSIIINGLSTLKPKTGVGHYVSNLHRALAQLGEHRVDLYPGPFAENVVRRGLAWLPRPQFRSNISENQPISPIRNVLNRSLKSINSLAKHAAKIAVGIHFARHSRANGYAVYHEPNFIPFATDLPTIVTVHDLSVVMFPEWHPLERVRHHERHFEAALKRASRIIVVSEQVRHEVLTTYSIAQNRVVAVPNGVGPEYHPRTEIELVECHGKHVLPKQFLLCVGTVEPRKNLLMAMRAYVDLPSRLRERCPLVLAGPWGWKSEPERAYYESVGRHANVRRLGYVEADDLPKLYAAASALVYPSRYEGFGLPPLEMLASGGVVFAATDTLAVRGVMGPYAVYLPADDLQSWRDAMRTQIESPDVIQQTRRAGLAHAAKFTWRATAEQTLAVYQPWLRPSRTSPLTDTLLSVSRAA